MFVVSLTYKVGLDVIDTHRPAHLEWLQKYYDSGLFLASGRKKPATGGVIICKDIPRDDLEKLLATDPFAQNDLADYDITEFEVKMSAPALEGIA